MKKRSLRNQKLIGSRKSKIVLSFIVLMFGVVIVLAEMDAVEKTDILLSPKENSRINAFISKGQENYEIEYKVPSYLPEFLKHPQKIFSGREIKIVKKDGKPLKEDELFNVKLSKRDKGTKRLINIKDVEVEIAKNKDGFITIPLETDTGYYTLEFQSNGEQYLFPIEINGLTEDEKNQIVNVQTASSSQDTSISSIKRLGCGDCYWESVIGINPNDENYGYLAGASEPHAFVQTKDGWQTSQVFDISQLTTHLFKNYAGDPKIAFTSDGKFILSSLLWNMSEPITGGVYQDSTQKGFPVQLKQTILQDVPPNYLNSDCSTLSTEVKSNITELESLGKIVIKEEGGITYKNQYLVISTSAGGTIVRVNQIYHSNNYIDDRVEFTDVFTGDTFIAAITAEGKGIVFIGGVIRYITYSASASPDNNWVRLTWGDDATYDDVGIEKELFYCFGPEDWILFDYPKIAIDTAFNSPYFNSIYVFVNYLWFDEPDKYQSHHSTGFLTIRGDEIFKQRAEYVGFYQPPQSALVSNGVIHIGRGDQFMFLYSSFNGGQSFVESIIDNKSYDFCAARISKSSSRGWSIYKGPELASDKQGRLYAVWANPKECVEDQNFEWYRYGVDFDILVSYSSDHGVTWSEPVKVNDDNSGGDQGFPDIVVDNEGIVYVAFLDHRENQDRDQFDVYFTYSNNGGLSFSRNIKLNDLSIPNTRGWRDPGDYLDMLAIGNTKIFVSHPCVNFNYLQDGRPSDACITTINKSNLPICGNSLLETGEQCDDGNTQDGDGCSASCHIEILCESGADTNSNGIIDQNELNSYVQKYYLGNVNINNVSNAIAEHLNGCG